MFYIGLNCSDGWGGRVVQVYETDGTSFGQFPENSPKIPENCMVYYSEYCFLMAFSNFAPTEELKEYYSRKADNLRETTMPILKNALQKASTADEINAIMEAAAYKLDVAQFENLMLIAKAQKREIYRKRYAN